MKQQILNTAFRSALLLSAGAGFVASANAADIDVIATQTAMNATYGLPTLSGNTTWSKDNAYILTDRLYVPEGVTLTIEPGTKIYSTTTNVGGDEDTSNDLVGAVIVCRGGMIDADGTAEEPIVFDALATLEAERGVDLPYDEDLLIGPMPSASTKGLWGGVVLLGNAYCAVTGSDGVNIGNKIIEGFVPTGFVNGDADGRPDVLEYGFDLTTNTVGTTFARDDADDSGTLRYVSIRHGGYEFGTDNEINGLTLAGVGSGTTISHIEIVANADDGVEFFGGTVNTDHIVVAYCDDDSFDIDEGHQGTHQFWFTIQNPNFGDNLGEWDGVGGAAKGSTDPSVIRSNPKIYNATFIGAGADSFTNADAKKDNGFYMEDYFNGQVYNSVVTDAVNFLTSVNSSNGNGGGIVFSHNTVGHLGRYDGSTASTVLSSAPTGYYISGLPPAPNLNNSAPDTDPMFSAYSRNAEGFVEQIDPRPASGSPLLTSAVASGAPVAASYRGAFDGTTNWAAGWTFLDESGFFGAAADTDGDGLSDDDETNVYGTSPTMADTDGDGINDGVEVMYASLGFDPTVADAASVFGGLYTESQILDLTTANQVIIQGGGAGQPVTLSLPLFSSDDLSEFEPAGALEATFNGTGAAEFYRIEIPSGE